MRHISSGLGKSVVVGLTTILALGPISLTANGRSAIGARQALLTAPTVPASPDASRGQAQDQGAPVITNETVIGDPGIDSNGYPGLVPTVRGKLWDFTNSGRTDWSILTFGTGTPFTWKILRNPASSVPGAAFIRYFDFGTQGTDSIRPQDFVGDTKSDPTVRRNGVYYSAEVPLGGGPLTISNTLSWGLPTDTSGGEGDYDGDMKIDYTVVRVNATVLTWYILLSSNNTLRSVTFGATGGQNTVLLNGADFNNDGRDELCFARYPANGATTWHAGDSVTGATVLPGVLFGDFDNMNAIPPADYTGDGIADLMEVVLDQANLIWYMRNGANGAVTATVFGVGDPNFLNFDYPLRGDYDGDGRHDIAVWRPSNQTYYVLQSSNGLINGQQWGTLDTDVPVASIGTF